MSSFWLKIIACVCMLIDHIGCCLVPEKLLFRMIGRFAFPIFAFQMTIGFEKTRSKEKYLWRMVLFTILSQFPYALFQRVSFPNPTPELNVGATLTLGLLILYCFEKIKNPWWKYSLMLLIFSIPFFVPMDYGWFGIGLLFLFYFFRKEKMAQGIFFATLLLAYCKIKNSLFALPAIYALVPILLYNGQKGRDTKYWFYLFYPLHLLVLALIHSLL